jgi:hypothetical protein
MFPPSSTFRKSLAANGEHILCIVHIFTKRHHQNDDIWTTDKPLTSTVMSAIGSHRSPFVVPFHWPLAISTAPSIACHLRCMIPRQQLASGQGSWQGPAQRVQCLHDSNVFPNHTTTYIPLLRGGFTGGGEGDRKNSRGKNYFPNLDSIFRPFLFF